MRKTLTTLLILFAVAGGTLLLAPTPPVRANTYATTSPLNLYPGACLTLFAATDGTPITTGTFSQQFTTTAQNASTVAISFEFVWSGNPGAFNLQIQDADTDATGNYVTLTSAGTITSTPLSAGNAYVSRVELNPWRAQYGRLYMNTQPANAVTLVAKVCR